MEKRGQSISLTTILLMVLGVVVIVLLIWGFSTGWSNMWEKVTGFGGGSSNVDSVRQSCDLACQAKQKDTFCTKSWTVNFGETRLTYNGTGPVNSTKAVASCHTFAITPAYKVPMDDCPGLCS